ncbi:MAG: proton-conducting transporter membrane subunit [Sulfurimonas sp.]
MSAFTLLFAFATLSLGIRSLSLLKLLSLIVLAFGTYFALHAYPLPLSGFYLSNGIAFFELTLFIILGAFVLNEDENINITQALFIGTASLALLESNTILNFIISFEALSIISFVLVANIKNTTEASGAVKMFIAGSIATALIVLGTAFYLFEGHSLNATLGETGTLGTIGLWIMLLGLFYKLTIVPMHTWAADSYAQIKASNAALLSGFVKTVAAIAIFKTFSPFLLQNIEFNMPILITLSIITMTLGNFLALFQKRVAKILAYSSIAHAGYMLLAFVAVKSSYASTGLLYIAIAYIFMQSALFMLIGNISKDSTKLSLEELKGLGKKDKIVALLFTLQLLSLAGVPLLAGFISKAVLVYAVVDVNLPIVALITLLNSALSVAYYAWIIKHIYFDETNADYTLKSLNAAPLLSQLVLLGGTLYFGIFAFQIFKVLI